MVQLILLKKQKYFINNNIKKIERIIDVYVEISSKIFDESKYDLDLIQKNLI